MSYGAACPGLRDQSLIVNGVSKAYVMTGWRVGYATGPSWLIKGMAMVQSQSVTSVCSNSQAATIAALDGTGGVQKGPGEPIDRRHQTDVGLSNYT